MSTTPVEAVPAQQLYGPALGQPPTAARLAGRRILVVGAGQRRIREADPPVGNGRAMAVTLARDALGGLDGLVLNVGIGNTSRFGTETADAWDAVMQVNLRAHMLGAQAAAAVMDDGGAIVFISSIAALAPITGIPAYEASKAALAAVCRATAMACHARGIRANVVAPGLIDTPVGRDAGRDRPGRATQPLPFGRQGTAWEVAHSTLFLLSAEASYVNGQVLVVDGGFTIGAVRAPA